MGDLTYLGELHRNPGGPQKWQLNQSPDLSMKNSRSAGKVAGKWNMGTNA